MKTLLTLLTILVSLTLTAQVSELKVDTLKFENSNFILFEKIEFEKMYKVDTCMTDTSGNFIYFIYKSKKYYGLTVKEFLTYLNKQKPTNKSINSTILLNIENSTIWGHNKSYVMSLNRNKRKTRII